MIETPCTSKINMTMCSNTCSIPSKNIASHSGKTTFIFLLLSLVSIFYELPIIYLFSSYRINPRIFDVMFFLFLIVSLFSIRPANTHYSNKILLAWGICVYAMVLASLMSLFWIPDDFRKYSIFFSIKYVISFLFLFFLGRMQLSENQFRILFRAIIVAGMVISMIAAFQVFSILPSFDRITVSGITSGSLHEMQSSTLESAFQLATQSVLCLSLALALMRSEKGVWRTILYLGIPILAMGSLASGVRSGIFLLILTIFIRNFVHHEWNIATRARHIILMVAIMGVIILIVGSNPKILEQFRAWSRLQSLYTSTFFLDHRINDDIFTGDNLLYRIVTPVKQLGEYFQWNPIRTILFGVGYGMSELISNDKVQHLHNIFLWPFQYGGVITFLAFIWVCILIYLGLKRATGKSSNPLTNMLACEMISFFFAWMMVGFSGQIFWFYEGTGNMTILLLSIWVLIIRAKGNMLERPIEQPT